MSKRSASPDASKQRKKKRYECKFSADFGKEFTWVKKSGKGDSLAFCTCCNVDFSIAHGGRNDLSRHANRIGHQTNLKIQNSVPKVNYMFAANAPDKVTVAETLFSVFIAEHNLSFSVADHFSSLVKTMFPDSEIAKKFSCKRTKTTHIMNNAIAPQFDKDVNELLQTPFSLMVDESNDKGGEKAVSILVRVYDQTIQRISTKFLAMPICNIGTGANIFGCINKVFNERGVLWKNCIGYSSDNASVMIGRNNSVLSRIKEENPEIFDLGCVCHLANICLQFAVKRMPVAVEDLLIDVYFHFHHSAKRKEEYKEFLEFTDTEPMKIIKHCSTRWLSLQNSVSRLLHHWPALQSYFSSHEDQEKNGRVKRCMEEMNRPVMLLHFMFLEFILVPLNEFNTAFQADESMIGYLHEEMIRLLRKFMGKFIRTKAITSALDITRINIEDKTLQLSDEYIAVGMKARTLLASEDVTDDDQDSFFKSVRNFYVDVSKKMVSKFPFGDRTLKDLGFLNPNLKEKIETSSVTAIARRFAPETEMDQLEEEYLDFQVSPQEEFPVFQPKATRLDEFWTNMGTLKLHTGKARFEALSKVALTVLVLPHSNAETERSFSILRKIERDDRGNLSNRTVNSLMSVKMNNNFDCFAFKPKKEMLLQVKKACSIEKTKILS